MSSETNIISQNKFQKSKFRRKLDLIKKQRWLLLMVFPAVIFMVIFNFYPIWFAQIGFRNYFIGYGADLAKAPWVGLEYIRQFVTSQDFGQVMYDTFGISICKLIVGFPIPILFAIFLSELKSLRLKKFVQTITYLPHFLSWVVVGVMIMTWMSDSGFLTKILYDLHFIKQQSNMLANPSDFWQILVGSGVWKEFGWNSIIFLAAIVSIDQNMYEAARIDGAGKMRQIINITLPSITPTITLMLILSISGLFAGNFDQIFVLQNAVNRPVSNVINIYTYYQAFGAYQYSYSTAVGLFESVVSALLLLISNQVSKWINGYSLF